MKARTGRSSSSRCSRVRAALAQTAGPAQTQQQFDEIAAADQALFSAFFDRCDIAALATMVTDDFEMFHDKNGFMAKSGKEFLDGIAGDLCAAENRRGLSRAPRAGAGHAQGLSTQQLRRHRNRRAPLLPAVARKTRKAGRGLAVHARLEERRGRLEARARAELRPSFYRPATTDLTSSIRVDFFHWPVTGRHRRRRTSGR